MERTSRARVGGGVWRHRRRRADDAGTTLVEVVLSVGIVGTLGVGILVSLLAAIRGADQRERSSALDATLVSAVELVHSDGVAYVTCTGDEAAVADTYRDEITAALPTSDGIVVEVSEVLFWSGTGFVAECETTAADTMQRVTVTVSDGVASSTGYTTKLTGTVLP